MSRSEANALPELEANDILGYKSVGDKELVYWSEGKN